MQKQFLAYSENDLVAVAKEIVMVSKTNKIFGFYGSMGAGKTTLIKKVCEELNVTDHVSSPTFSLVNEYETGKKEFIYHFDFYRINSIKEATDIGFDEYLYSGNVCFIEWPEKIEALLPEDTIKVNIIPEENKRKIILNI